ncbi:hypothetical protein SS50377_24149 [Spironucleus salmonicida]|uniref:Uncharacterized protein n=1 Tax=Spironucleus salmonicida TaxID=348837 RepID=V6M6J3_9EUKA|nr:hypothetical protein SS50377_24149 [Spironucleus salmonicida]|eukprot:EST49029.1 Hypothetical protein SS50377_10727 [Spironucleus salmonicida]
MDLPLQATIEKLRDTVALMPPIPAHFLDQNLPLTDFKLISDQCVVFTFKNFQIAYLEEMKQFYFNRIGDAFVTVFKDFYDDEKLKKLVEISRQKFNFFFETEFKAMTVGINSQKDYKDLELMKSSQHAKIPMFLESEVLITKNNVAKQFQQVVTVTCENSEGLCQVTFVQQTKKCNAIPLKCIPDGTYVAVLYGPQDLGSVSESGEGLGIIFCEDGLAGFIFGESSAFKVIQ